MKIDLLEKIANRLSSGWRQLKQRSNRQNWPDRSIVFYTGHTDYVWSPENLETGLGGGDARIIYLTREWVKLGYQVTVYSNCGQKEGLYDGVQYLNYQKFNQYDRFDTLIMWHFAWRLKFPIIAKRVWLDLGKGVLLPEEAKYEKLKKYDKIFCKNNYHRSTLPEIPDGKIAIIPNGVESSYLELRQNEKDPDKVIYASNYIRGLERMLEFGWPIVKKAVPSAQLHIYYGWPREVDPAWKEKMLKLMNQPGVIEHGKVGRDRIMQEKSTAIIHYYGCTFKELDCNTVRESAFVGCIPVTTDYAGLQDKDYCIKIPGNPYQKETQEAVAGKIVELLPAPEKLVEIRQQFFECVKDETWERVAKLWLEQMENGGK